MSNSLFVAKKRLYPQSAKGKIRNIKWILNIIFLSIYIFSPFLRFNRGDSAPNQAILIDLPNSKAYFFFIEIWPQEVYYLAGILIISAIALFFVTSLFGRIWCGYACFQTVWTDIFIALEKLFQGDRNNRIILDRKNNFQKFWRKSLTHISWILVSLITAFGFVCYFNDSFLLIKNLLSAEISFNILGWILGIASMTYLMAGFAREHVCTFMCPYSRFQSAMFDDNTLIIAYDEKRGEPREKAKKGANFDNRGHCIDCKQCVVVCPTGIDIRNGLQMECIACGLCIDACNEVMDKMDLPRGLIRYDTLNHLSKPSLKNKFKILKPRTLFYSIILTLICSVMLVNLMNKSTLELSIIPNRNPIFVLLSDGSIRNGYDFKIINKTHDSKQFRLNLRNPKDAILRGQNFDLDNFRILPEQEKSFKIFISIAPEFLEKSDDKRFIVELEIEDLNSKEIKTIESIFIGN